MSRPQALFRGAKLLTPSELELALATTPITRVEGTWRQDVREHGLTFDLSSIEWVDLGAASQIVLIVDRALSDGIHVRVLLPSPGSESDPRKALYIGSAATYLGNARFVDALVQSERWWDSGRLEIVGKVYGRRGHEPSYSKLIPITWVGTGAIEPTALEAMFREIIAPADRGMDIVDATTLARIVLRELADNVTQHAGPRRRCLVSGWCRPREKPWPANDAVRNYLDIEATYVGWLREQNASLVELMVGDSGVTIPASLSAAYRTAQPPRPSDLRHDDCILHWAWGKWTTSATHAKTGTRGLYKVDRIVQKYNGYSLTRSGASALRIDRGGPQYQLLRAFRDRPPFFPGTYLRLRFPAVTLQRRGWRSSSENPRAEPAVKLVRRLRATSTGIVAEDLAELEQILARQVEPCWVICDVGGPEDVATELCLQQLCAASHPPVLVCYGLGPNWDAVETAVDSVNSCIAERRLEAETGADVLDPVLVLGKQGQARWVGGGEKLRSALDAALHQDGSLLGASLDEDLLSEIREERGLFSREEPIVLRETPRTIMQFLRTTVQWKKQHGTPAGYYITPSLRSVTEWIDVRAYFADTSARLAAFCLARMLADALPDVMKELRCVVADTNVYSETIRELQQCLSVPHVYTFPGETEAYPAPRVVLERGAHAVVFCDIISSSESALRLIKQAMRDSALVVCVLCCIDARTVREPLTIYGRQVPILALDRHASLEPVPGATFLGYINPVTRGVEEDGGSVRNAEYVLSKQRTAEIMSETEALYYGHMRSALDRHYTLHAAPGQIIANPDFVDAFLAEIRSWTDGKATEIWIPAGDPARHSVTYGVAKEIQRAHAAVRIRTMTREPGVGSWVFPDFAQVREAAAQVVILDWGAITGTTIINGIRLAAVSGAKRVLVMVALSHLRAGEEAFYRDLRTVRGRAARHQAGLFEPASRKAEREAECEVRVRFIASLAVRVYGLADCPVCSQRRDIMSMNPPGTLLQEYASGRLRALGIRNREDVRADGIVSVGASEATTASLLWVLEFREKLEEGMSRTAARHHVAESLAELSREVRARTAQAHVVRGMLLFLATETHWLRRPPLSLKAVQASISDIALNWFAQEDAAHEQCHAVMVLRSNDKFDFVERLPELIAAARSEDVDATILFGAFTFLERDYHANAKLMDAVAQSLSQVVDVLGRKACTSRVRDTAALLCNRARVKAEMARAAAKPMETTWSTLRDELSSLAESPAHTHLKRTVLQLEPGMWDVEVSSMLGKAPGTELSAAASRWLRDLGAKWEEYCEFVDKTMLPHLKTLHGALATEDGKTWFGFQYVEWLLRVVGGATPYLESEESAFVRRMAAEPGFLTVATWEKYKSILRRITDCFGPAVSTDSARRCRVLDMLRAVPSDLVGTFRRESERVLAGRDVEIAFRGEDVPALRAAFLPRTALEDAASTIVENLIKHRDAEQRMRVELRFMTNEREDVVGVDVINSGTRPSEPVGHGVETIRARIVPFGASIELVRPEAEWACFQTRLRIRRALR